MNSEILNYLGLGGIDAAWLFILPVILILLMFIVLLVIIIRQGKKITKLQKSYAKFMLGKDAQSMESEIEAITLLIMQRN